jgi:hypothetical protein
MLGGSGVLRRRKKWNTMLFAWSLSPLLRTKIINTQTVDSRDQSASGLRQNTLPMPLDRQEKMMIFCDCEQFPRVIPVHTGTLARIVDQAKNS